MTLEFRPIQPQDHDAVRAFLAGLGWQHRVADAARFRKMMERADRTVVVFDNARVIGFGRALCDGVSNGYLSMIAVAPDKRGQGIGREIIRRLMAEDEDDDVTWVLRAGRDSSEFWKKLNFTESTVAMELTRSSKKL